MIAEFVSSSYRANRQPTRASEPNRIECKGKCGGFYGDVGSVSKKNEQIVIGDGIVITIVDVRGDKVRIGIEAPPHVPVHRHEVYVALLRASQAPPAVANETVDEA